MADTPPPAPSSDPALAKPSAPSPQMDPPGIAASMMKKDGQALKQADLAEKARREEELEALDGLPSAAGED